MTAKSSSWFLFFICHDNSSLKSMNCIEPLLLHSTVSDHTESSSVQDHRACNGVSTEAWHLTQRGSGDILQRNKALFVGMALRQALHNRVFTFGGNLYRPNLPPNLLVFVCHFPWFHIKLLLLQESIPSFTTISSIIRVRLE